VAESVAKYERGRFISSSGLRALGRLIEENDEEEDGSHNTI